MFKSVCSSLAMSRLPATILFSVFFLLQPAIADAASKRKQTRQARADIKEATETGKTKKFRNAMKALLELRGHRELENVLESFAVLVEEKLEQGTSGYFEFFSKTAKSLGRFDDAKSVKELKRLRKRAHKWPARLIIMEAANFTDELDIRELALESLHDESPVIVKRSLFYLRNAKKDLNVIDAVLERYLEIDGERKYAKDIWDHARVAFRDALARLLRIRLNSAIDYKNYYEPRRDSPDLFSPQKQEGAARLNLFGAPLTGKNIIFLLDRSGSMQTTDKIKIPPGKGSGKTGRREDLIAERIERGRRINRARNELTRVVKSLPDDMNFNILTFSSGIEEWKSQLVPTSESNKKKAVKFIEKIEADGVTVTDQAIAVAFSNVSLDTIYLITDGAPSHVGGQGGKELPSDAREIINQILEDVPILNYLRGVRIFTLGFPQAEEKFLKKLSKQNSGTYTPIQ